MTGRITRQRRAVADALASLAGRFTVGELHERARARCQGLGLATTYRTLELLRAEGAVRAVAGATGLYIRCHPGHHHHLVCLRCGDVQETELCGAPAPEELRLRHGFRAESHELDIYGLCARCAA